MSERRQTTLVRTAFASVGILNILVVVFAIARAWPRITLGAAAAGDLLGMIGWLVQVVLGALYSALGILLAIRAKPGTGVLPLAGYIIAQGLATGFLMAIPFDAISEREYLVIRALVNLLAYSLALRAVQVFPTALDPAGVASIGGRRTMRIFAFPVSMALGPVRVWLIAAALLALSLASPYEAVFHLGQLAVIALVVATMTVNYKTSGPTGRKKIYWLLLGALVMLVSRVVIFTSHILILWLHLGEPGDAGLLRQSVWALANLGLIACLYLAVFYEGAVDPRLALRRAAVYSLGAGIAIFVFAAFENFVSSVLAEFFGVRQGLLQAFAGAVVAMFFKVMYDRLSALFERLLPKTEGTGPP